MIEIRHILKPEGKCRFGFRIGLTLTVSDALDQVKWYGRGPQENYPDRKTGYPTGIYSSTVQDMRALSRCRKTMDCEQMYAELQLTADKGIGLLNSR